MDHPRDQLISAAELLADGVPRKDAADRLAEQFDISQATAYRRLAQAESDAGAEHSCTRPTFDLVEFIAEQYVQLVRGAADDEAKLNALAGLTSACSKLKLRYLSFDP